jgi:hypothetical protein
MALQLRKCLTALPPAVTPLRILTLHGLHKIAFRSAKRRSFAERTATKRGPQILIGVPQLGKEAAK